MTSMRAGGQDADGPGPRRAGSRRNGPGSDAGRMATPAGAGEPPAPLRPTALELASGVVLGERWEPRLPQVPASLTPRQALEDAILPALECMPCLVSFSGGRDSSVVLALAAAVARRHGLPAPVPFTVRFPGVAMADESEWQELVVRHLRLDDWQRYEAGDGELDLVGPVATRLMRRHGVLWPSNAHLVEPACRAASGGSLLTGLEGDGLLGAWRCTTWPGWWPGGSVRSSGTPFGSRSPQPPTRSGGRWSGGTRPLHRGSPHRPVAPSTRRGGRTMPRSPPAGITGSSGTPACVSTHWHAARSA